MKALFRARVGPLGPYPAAELGLTVIADTMKRRGHLASSIGADNIAELEEVSVFASLSEREYFCLS